MSKNSSRSRIDEIDIRYESVQSDSSNVLVVMQTQLKGITLHGRKCLPNFTISQNLHKRLLQYVNMKKEKAGLLCGTATNKYSYELQHLNIVEDFKEQQISQKVFLEEEACATIVIKNRQLLKERLLYEAERCKQGFIPPAQPYKNQGLSVLEQVYLSVMRMFLFVKQQKQEIKVKQYTLFPSITLTVKTLKLASYKFDSSSLLKKLIHTQTENDLSFKQELEKGTYGFLLCNQTKLSVVKRTDSSIKSKPVVGLWIHLKGVKKENQFQLSSNSHRLIWGLAAMFIINKGITKYNVLINQQQKRKLFANSFLLCVFSEHSTKPYIYQIEFQGAQNKWVFMENEQHILMPNVPLNFNMGSQCEISDALQTRPDRLQTKRESLERLDEERQFVPDFKKYDSDNMVTQRNFSQKNYQKKNSANNKVYSNDTFARSEADAQSLRQSQFNDRVSEKSYDEKDIQIRELKKQLQFYKERYQNLEKILLSQSLFQQAYPQIINPMMGMVQNSQMPNNMMPKLPPGVPIFPNGFQYMGYPIPGTQHSQTTSPIYYPLPQTQFQQYSSQVNYHSNVAESNQMVQSSVVDSNKESAGNSLPFIKKPSSHQTLNIKLKEASPQQNKILTESIRQQQSQKPYQQPQEQTEVIDQQQQQIPFQHKIQADLKLLDQNSKLELLPHQQQFLQFTDKQFDLNFSSIPHQRSPKPSQDRQVEAPQILDQQSLAYSYSREHHNRYSLPNQDSHDYQQNEQAKLIETLFKNKFK